MDGPGVQGDQGDRSTQGSNLSTLLPEQNAETETAVVGAAYLAVKYVGNIGSSIGPLQVVTALFGVYQSLEMPVRWLDLWG